MKKDKVGGQQLFMVLKRDRVQTESQEHPHLSSPGKVWSHPLLTHQDLGLISSCKVV